MSFWHMSIIASSLPHKLWQVLKMRINHNQCTIGRFLCFLVAASGKKQFDFETEEIALPEVVVWKVSEVTGNKVSYASRFSLTLLLSLVPLSCPHSSLMVPSLSSAGDREIRLRPIPSCQPAEVSLCPQFTAISPVATRVDGPYTRRSHQCIW